MIEIEWRIPPSYLTCQYSIALSNIDNTDNCLSRLNSSSLSNEFDIEINALFSRIAGQD